MKQQNFHKSQILTLIIKNKRFMIILSFHEDSTKPLRSHKMIKGLYLHQMTSNPKNKGTLFSSTFKVEEKNVHLFF